MCGSLPGPPCETIARCDTFSKGGRDILNRGRIHKFTQTHKANVVVMRNSKNVQPNVKLKLKHMIMVPDSSNRVGIRVSYGIT